MNGSTTMNEVHGRAWPVRSVLVAVLVAALAMVGLVTSSTTARAAVNPGQWYVIESAHSGLVLDVAGRSTQPGALLTQWGRTDGHNQQFRFLDSGDGRYWIQARHSGLVLDVFGWNADNGADIAQWEDLNGTNQQWEVTPTVCRGS